MPLAKLHSKCYPSEVANVPLHIYFLSGTYYVKSIRNLIIGDHWGSFAIRSFVMKPLEVIKNCSDMTRI